MKMFSAILLASVAAHDAASTAPFIAPEAHPITRYEAGWKKNPFTLKTAPPAVEKVSFAKDLALAGWRQAGDDNIVILVNTKTKEYTRLKNDEPGPGGMKVKSAHLEDRRADTFVELELKDEKALVRYDETFLKGMATVQLAAAKANPQVAMRGQNVAGQPLPPGMSAAPAAQSNLAPNINPPGSSSARVNVVPTVPNPQLPQSVPSPGNNVPTIQRRRLNTLPQPPPQR